MGGKDSKKKGKSKQAVAEPVVDAGFKPITALKASKKLKKKLGRKPTEEEVAAFVTKINTKRSKKARKRKAEPDAASTKEGAADADATQKKRKLDKAKGAGKTADKKKSKKSKGDRQKDQGAAAASEDAAGDAAEDTARSIVAAHGADNSAPPATKPTPDMTTIVLFYGYIEPQFSKYQQDDALDVCHATLTEQGCTGRLRVGREGFNGTLTGPYDGTRAFVEMLRQKYPATFGEGGDAFTNFKFVDGLPPNQRLKELKVFPVTEIVTYGFDPRQAPLDMRGTHLSPAEFHKALEWDNTICLDVRNFNESLIGKFVPPGDVPITGAPGKVTDMRMRRSTDFPMWVNKNKAQLEGKKVLMYCTAGIRCERASAFLRKKGFEDVYQLDGGVHRYLEEFKEDGGHWKGKNYTFDKRFGHGADNAECISECVHCGEPWERYQANAKCTKCKMEVLFCRRCQRTPKKVPKSVLCCPICKPGGNKAGPQPIAPSKYLDALKAKAEAEAANQ